MSHSRVSTSRSPRVLFDEWIRNRFPTLNTELERGYENARTGGIEAPADLARTMRDEGRGLITKILASGELEGTFDDLFAQLGNVGLYMAACKRHGLNEPREGHSPLLEASRLALSLGSKLDVAPRFLAAHLSLLNPAQEGRYKVFTFLEAERIFIDYNTRAIVAYRQAAELLKAVLGVGISGRWAPAFLEQAQAALQIALEANRSLMEELSAESFFYSVRPYYRPHYVGDEIFRGANAGDFAAISEVDLILGVCSTADPFYGGLLDEKLPYLIPEDRATLNRTRERPSLLDYFLEAAQEIAGSKPDWWPHHLSRFLEVCRLHGAVATLHHNGLVNRFIVRPSRALPDDRLNEITASGPPLGEVLVLLERLRDLRRAAPRKGIHSRYRDFELLEATLTS